MDLTKDPRYLKLRKFNLAMGVLHLVSALIMLSLLPESSAPVWGSFLTYDQGDPLNPNDDTIFPVTEVLFNLPIGIFVSLFLFVSAIAHFALASPQGYPWYVKNLDKGMNPARWYEYMISSSIMIVVVAMLCGIYELSSLIALFALNATMNMMGLMMEVHNQSTQKTNWLAFKIGCFAGFVPWLVMGIYFFAAILPNAETVPTFVYAIFFVIAIFFNVFALNMVWQYRRKGKWADYLYGEKVYIILSLTAKSALAWFVFGGTFRF